MPFQTEKECTHCKQTKPAFDFNWRNKIKGWLKPLCRACESKRFKEYYEIHREEMCARGREYHKTWKDVRFEQVLDALGHECACCAEKERIFLTVDHINNDGYKEKYGKDGVARAGRTLWSRLRKEGYPKDRYRILCFNRTADKRCPHELNKET